MLKFDYNFFPILGDNITIHLYMEGKNLPPFISHNTISEIKGRELANETVIVSGHLDSWDVGQGAMDDGGGAFIAWNALVLLRQLNLRPRRTLRSILWTGEEEGLWGAQGYFKDHKNELKNVKLVMESDEGTFNPRGLSFSGNVEAQCIVREVLKLMEPINATKFESPEDGGPDISLWTRVGVPGMSLINDNEKYFWFHHSNGDMMTVENPEALDRCLALWTAAAYVFADMSQPLPSNIS